MKLRVVGCSHHRTPLDRRERLAFDPSQAGQALLRWKESYPQTEAVLLSTCNRVEIYTAADDASAVPSQEAVASFLADCHKLEPSDILTDLFEENGEDMVRHLFTVAASLDSMVLGEPQILAQVKQAYRLAQENKSTGPLTNLTFQTAVKVARNIANETTIHQHRVSIPSVAVADFASQIFETFADKRVVVIGAGEMGEETLRFLQEAGAHDVTVVNRKLQRAQQIAERWNGRGVAWEKLDEELIAADVVISTTGASMPIIGVERFQAHIAPLRQQRNLVILDLAIPRDFEPGVGDLLGVYLYSIDDLTSACERNRRRREEQLPAALKIVEAEVRGLMRDLNHRVTAPIIRSLRAGWQGPKEEELQRLLNKLPDLDEVAKEEISNSFDRLINKLLHPPLESLRDESQAGAPHGLLEAVKRLFQIRD